MTPTKLLIGQILTVLAIMVLGVWASTQWAAAMLAYQPELGAPWFLVCDIPVYRPWALFVWWYHFEAYAPDVFDRAGALAGTSGFLGCGAAIGGSPWRARQARFVTTYGSARWATEKEIDAAGLFEDRGVFLGRLRTCRGSDRLCPAILAARSSIIKGASRRRRCRAIQPRPPTGPKPPPKPNVSVLQPLSRLPARRK